jgi:hypothetical protein
VAAPRPNIALLLAERGDKPPQREAIEGSGANRSPARRVHLSLDS